MILGEARQQGCSGASAGGRPDVPCALEDLRPRLQGCPELGNGAQGFVVVARNRSDRGPVALKVSAVRGEGDLKLLRGVQRACWPLRHHLNFAVPRAVYPARLDGKSVICQEMEHAKGPAMACILQGLRKTSAGSRVHGLMVRSVFGQCCCVLRELGALSLVHLDLKPANMALVAAGEAVRLVLLDFDLLARQGQVIGSSGTPVYMPLEALASGARARANGATDRYAMGVILYQFMHADLTAHPYLLAALVAAGPSPAQVLSALVAAQAAGAGVQWGETALSSSTPEMRLLVERLLELDVSRRMGMEELLASPLWEQEDMRACLYERAADAHLYEGQQQQQQQREKEVAVAVQVGPAVPAAGGVADPAPGPSPSAAPVVEVSPAPSPAAAPAVEVYPAPSFCCTRSAAAAACPPTEQVQEPPVGLLGWAASLCAVGVLLPLVAVALPPLIMVEVLFGSPKQQPSSQQQQTGGGVCAA